MKGSILLLSAVSVLFITFLFDVRGNPLTASVRNQCIACHTNVKKLIRLSWEVERIKPELKSSKTSGEG